MDFIWKDKIWGYTNGMDDVNVFIKDVVGDTVDFAHLATDEA